MRWYEIVESNKGKEHRHMPDWKVKERLGKGMVDGTYVPDMFTDDGDVMDESEDEDNQVI